jgi:hypothetical protein
MKLDHALPLIAPIQAGHGPQPTPVQISCGTIQMDNKLHVVIQISNSSGVQILFIPPEMANNVAQNLTDAATKAAGKPGLPVIPVGVIGGEATMTIGRKS